MIEPIKKILNSSLAYSMVKTKLVSIVVKLKPKVGLAYSMVKTKLPD